MADLIAEQKPKRRYRTVDGHRVMVVEHMGFEGFIACWTDSCSGCFEAGEYMGNAHNYSYDSKAKCHVGGGCDECGYTGKRRHRLFIAFDEPAFQKHLDEECEKGRTQPAEAARG